MKPLPPVDGCLSASGIAQAEALGRALANQEIDRVVCSSYGRAIQTAEVALAGRSIPFHILDALREWTPCAEYRALTSDESERINAQHSEIPAEMTWKTQLGEGTYDVYARVVPTFLSYLDSIRVHPRYGGFVIDPEAADLTVALFAHGGSLNVLLCHLLGVRPFPAGTFCLDLTGVAEITFREMAGVSYPQLRIRTLPASEPTNPMTMGTFAGSEECAKIVDRSTGRS